MVTLNITRTLPEPNMFFLPMLLKARVLDEFKKQNIPFKSYKRTDYNPDDYVHEMNLARMNFAKNHYDCDLTRLDAIESKISPEDIFDLCLQLFGPTMDPDEKATQEKYKKESWNAYLANANYLDGTIPIRKA